MSCHPGMVSAECLLASPGPSMLAQVTQIHATNAASAPYMAQSRASQPAVPTLLFLALHSLSRASFEYLVTSQVRKVNACQLSLTGGQAHQGQ